MRSVMILLALSAVPGCVLFDDRDPVEDPDPPGPGPDPDPTPPPPAGNGALGKDRLVAAGTSEHYSRPVLAARYVDMFVESSHPDLMEPTVIDPDTIGFVTHAPGAYTMTLRRVGSGELVDEMIVDALPVDGIVFDDPRLGLFESRVESFDLMANGQATVCATYFAGAFRLPGHGEFATTGTLAVAGLDVSGQEDVRSTCTRIQAGAIGPAELVASVEGGIAVPLPVEVHARPASSEIDFVEAFGELEVIPTAGAFIAARLDSRTPAGKPLRGVTAEWTVTPDTTVIVGGDLVLFEATAAGTTMTFTAAIGDLTVTRSVVIQ